MVSKRMGSKRLLYSSGHYYTEQTPHSTSIYNCLEEEIEMKKKKQTYTYLHTHTKDHTALSNMTHSLSQK